MLKLKKKIQGLESACKIVFSVSSALKCLNLKKNARHYAGCMQGK